MSDQEEAPERGIDDQIIADGALYYPAGWMTLGGLNEAARRRSGAVAAVPPV